MIKGFSVMPTIFVRMVSNVEGVANQRGGRVSRWERRGCCGKERGEESGIGGIDWGRFQGRKEIVGKGAIILRPKLKTVHFEASDCKEMMRDGRMFLIVGATVKQ
ncbi:hypothetical protein Acr_28g0002570 [Actinidia rufa]|uniref:Uncharacterized protein n=1 Tax=Actinidia rufa TaxID=165716 RepID=A0A7J0H8X3_9ERIC|nr:hypothetical protein Acr_28g0002570 [Actinidia rufa]